MAKCDCCKEQVQTTFLEKPKGTYIGAKKKRKLVCNACQKKYSMDEIKKKIGLL